MFGFRLPSTRLRDLEDRTRDLESTVKALEIEWADTYDKIRSILGKIAKRNARAAEDAPGEQIALSPDIDPYSAQIRASRRAGRIP